MLPEIMMLLIVISIVGLGFMTTSRSTFDVMFFFLCLVLYRHFPVIFYVFGKHGGGQYIHDALAGDALLMMAGVFSLFMISLYAGFLIMKRGSFGQSLFPSYLYKRSHNLVILGLICLTVGGLFVTIIPLYHAGWDVFKAINLVRNLQFYEGISFLKKFIQFGTLLSGAYLIDRIAACKKGDRVTRLTFLIVGGIFTVNIFFGFIMGGKGFIIFPLAFVAITYGVCCTDKPLRAIVMPVMALILLIITLQFTRIVFVKESHIQDPIETIYGALHFDVMDSNVVFLDTLGVLHSEEMGETFLAGLYGVVPRFLWPNKPAQITAGGAFKRSLNPDSKGGWPVFAYNQWYSSFGWIGLIVGGFITGWILSLIHRRYGRYRDDPFSVFISYILVLYFLSPTGLQNEIFINFIFFIVPLFLFKVCTQDKWIEWLTPRRHA